jgi:hypothetical protein
MMTVAARAALFDELIEEKAEEVGRDHVLWSESEGIPPSEVFLALAKDSRPIVGDIRSAAIGVVATAWRELYRSS